MQNIDLIIALLLTSIPFSQIEQTPCPRNQPVIVYNLKENSIFLFGGFCSTEKKRLNDFWKFDGKAWSSISVEEAPEPRSGHSMVYDSFRDRLIVFGGKNEKGEVLNDLWSWNGLNWKLLSENGPVPRQSHRMVFNSDNGDFFLFGGSNAFGESLNDSWIFNNGHWMKSNSKNLPPPRLQHTMTYDPQRKKVVLFGGFSKSENGKVIYGDTWEWQILEGWKLKDKNEQIARDHHAMIYDIKSKRTVFFGGYNEGYLGDTWSWDGEKWILVAEDGPSKRAGKPGMIYNSMDKSVILFGGWDKNNRPLMDFWQFNSSSNSWSIYDKK